LHGREGVIYVDVPETSPERLLSSIAHALNFFGREST